MAQQLISVGTLANDNTGDTLRDAFIKTNANFSEIYTGNPTLTGSPTLSPSGNGSVTITNAGTSSALRITQTGSGNALLVEDETNPDTTPFTITALGRVGIGTTSPESNFHMYAVDTGLNPFFERNEDGVGGVSLTGRRSRGTVSAKTALTNGDVIGGYAALGYDGANYQFRGGFRFIVDGAVSANNVPTSLVLETGTTTSPTARITIDSAGRVGIGSSTANSSDLRINKATTGNINQYGVLAEFTTQSDVTNAQYGFTTSLATQATSFTLANLRHFAAVFQSIGAGSTVTNQVGFFAGSSLIGAANNYGFYSDIASGSNRWNFYANGTATNYFAGNVFIGNTNSGGTERLFVEQTADAHTARIVNTSTSGALRGLQIHSTANNIPGVTMSRWYSSFAGNADVGQVRFDGLGTGGAYVEHAAIYAIATGANTATGAPTKLSFKTSDGSASVERMAISGTGVVSAVANITSTSTTTGSLIVTGGTGISENLWVGGYINVDNLRLQDNTLSSTNANGNIVLAPNGTGDVQLDADTVRIGDLDAAVTLTTNGASNLTINTGAVGATAAGNSITIQAGTGGATSGAGGALTVQAGSAQTSGTGGALALYGGIAVGTNQTGSNTVIRAGNGTGTGGSGSIQFQVAPAGSTGAVTNTYGTQLILDSAARVAVGSGSIAANSAFSSRRALDSTVFYGVVADGTVTSTATGTSAYLSNFVTQAASFTLPQHIHYQASQTVPGAGSFITNQYGFVASSSLVYAANNYGFISQIPAGGTATITSVARTTNVVTITTLAAHGFATGQSVTVAATTNTSLNGTFVITGTPTTTTFTYSQSGSDIAPVADTGSTKVVGRWNFYANGTADNHFNSRILIGRTYTGNERLGIGGSTSAAGESGIYNDTTIGSATTTAYTAFNSYLSTAAASFTLTNLTHYNANLFTIGAGSIITNQYGFSVGSSLIGATNNFGFYSNIASGTGRWNFYANGTAANYFAGTLSIAANTTSTSTTTGALVVTGGVGISENLWVGGYINVDNLRLQDNTLSSTNTDGNIVLAPNGTGDVQLDADTVRVGDSNAAATVTTNGTGNLTVRTGSTNSGSILINQGDNGVISIQTHGTGEVVINDAGNAADFRVEGDGDANLLIADASVDRVGIGINAPATKLHIQQTNAATNSVTRLLRIDNYSTGTPANGIGVGLEFGVETTDNNLEIGAAIEAVVTDVTATSEDFDIVFRTMGAGAAAAERVRISSNTTSTTTTTGAIVVTGGVGASGAIRAGGEISIEGGQFISVSGPSGGTRIRRDGGLNGLDLQTASTSRLFISDSGPVTITSTTASTSTTTGALIVGGGVGIAGALNATTKSFIIDHPTKPGKLLRHGSLEGPEFGVYVRGKLNGNVIELPEYWTKLVDPNSITVQLTPIGKHQRLYVEDIRDNKVYVGNEGLFSGEAHCFYYIQGERIDVDKLEVESS